MAAKLSNSPRRFTEEARQKLTALAAGLSAGAGLVSLAPAHALEVDQLLSYNAGRFLIQPQLDLSSQFTGNLFYAPSSPNPGGVVVLPARTVTGEEVLVPVLTPASPPEESDLLWYISPGMELTYGRNPENTLTLSYFHDFIQYTHNSVFNSGQDRVQFDVHTEFGRFVLVGSDSAQWLDTILGGNTATVRRVPISRLVWTDNYRLTYDATMKTDAYASFNHNLVNYLQPVNLYDQGTLGGALGATYKPTERIGVFVEGTLAHTDVTPNLPAAQSQPSPSYLYGGFVGARGNFTARLDGSVKVGYQVREFQDQTVQSAPGASTPAVGLALNYTPSAKLFLNLAYDRSVGVSSQYANQAYVYNNFFLTANQIIGTTGRWMVQGRLGFSLGDYLSNPVLQSHRIVVPPGEPAEFRNFSVDYSRHDQTYTASVGLIYQPRAWLKSSLVYSFEKYNAAFDDEYVALTSGLNDFIVNRVSLQVSIGY